MSGRAALAYLVASGTAAISVLDDGTIKSGKLDCRACGWRIRKCLT